MDTYKEQKNTIIKNIITIITTVESINIDVAVDRINSIATNVTLDDCRDDLKFTHHLLINLKNANFDLLGYSQLQALSSTLQQSADTLLKINNFKVEGNTPAISQLNPLKTAINNSRNTLQQHVLPFVAIIQQQTDVKKLNDLIKTAKESISIIQKNKTVSDELLASTKQVAEKAGVSTKAVYFQEEAKSHKNFSYTWLGITFILLLAACYFITTHLDPENFIKDLKNTDKDFLTVFTIQYIVFRLLIFSIISYAIVWTSKNYFAHRHNYVVNKHRQNLLSTFEVFVNSANDTIKDAVLLETTRCIFAHLDSGYLGKNNTPNISPQLIEIIKDNIPNTTKG
jgi:hypothetical protein